VERTDPGFRRVMEAVDVFRLRTPDDGTFLHEDRFLDFYSAAGIRAGIEAYGLAERLAELGLSDFTIHIDREDAFHHRLVLALGDRDDDDHRILDLRAHLRDVVVDVGGAPRTFHALGIDWLAMQNPRAAFTAARPKLPGQRHPGGGLGRAMHNILLIMAMRIGRDALVAVPQRFHLARLYHRAGYRFARADENRALDEVGAALRGLSFAAGAWAVERGCVRHAPSTERAGEPFAFVPKEMLLPIGVALKDVLRDAASALVVTVESALSPSFVVDTEALRRSLLAEPVPGLDPTNLG